MVEMSDGLTHREKALLSVEVTPEKYGYELCRGSRVRRRGFELGKTSRMMRAQLLDARPRTDKRQAMRGKDQGFPWQLREALERA